MPVKIFFCYARQDEKLLNTLKRHLTPLQRQGLIDMWYDRDISAGAEWRDEIDKYLSTAQIILLLVSSTFVASDYCYGVEMKRAIERHERGDARVIPIILRWTLWRDTPIGKLQALPKDGKPIMDRGWQTRDYAFCDVAEGIRKAVEEVRTKTSVKSTGIPIQEPKLVQQNSVRLISPQPVLQYRVTNATASIKPKVQQFKAGDKVHHSQFGEGIILKSEMERGTEFIEVQFQGTQGKKRLSLDYHKIQQFKSNDKVHHDTFGEGVVLKSEMEGQTEFVEVQFQDKHGRKRFHMGFAKLEKL